MQATTSNMTNLGARLAAISANDTWFPLIARVLIAAIFLWSGIGKATNYGGAAQYMVGAGISSVILPLVIAVEVGGATLLIIGWQARLAAAALALFTLLAALLFHKFWAVPEQQVRLQQIQFMKNVSMVGGLLYVVAYGAGAWRLASRTQGEDRLAARRAWPGERRDA